MASSADLALLLAMKGQDSVRKGFKDVSNDVSGLEKVVKAPINAVNALGEALGKIGLAAMGVSALAGAASGLGAALGVGLASNMETVRAQLLAFTKDGAKADEILGQIRAEADKTPFAFNEMATATASLLPASKQAGVGLMDLVKQAEILAALNPAEGLEGAAFSLREALSGDFTSIVERFNLPRDAINKLKEQGVPALEIVSRALQGMGADASLVANLAGTTAGRLSTFQDSIDGLRVAAGKVILESLGKQLDKLSALVDDNKDALTEFARLVGDGIGQAIDVSVSAVLGMIDVFHQFEPTIRLIGNTLTALVHGDFANFANGVRQLVQGAIDSLADKFSAFAPTGERLGQLFGVIGERIQDLIPYAQGFVEQMQDSAEAAGGAEGIMQSLANTVNTVSAAVVDVIQWTQQHKMIMTELGAVVSAMIGAWATYQAIQIATTVATTAFTAAANIAKVAMLALDAAMAANPIGLVVVAIGALVAALVYLYTTNDAVRERLNAAWEAIKNVVAAVAPAVIAKVTEIGTFIQGLGNSWPMMMVNIGRALGEGLIRGIQNILPAIAQKAAELGQAAINAAKNALGIASPSKEFAEIGENTAEGLAEGIEQATDVAVEAATTMAEAVYTPVDKIARDFERKQEDAARDHGRRMADLEEELGNVTLSVAQRNANENLRFERQMSDLRADLQGASAKERKAINERIADAEKAHQRKLEDIQSKGNQDQLQQRQQILDQIANENKRYQEQQEDMEIDHQRKLQDARDDGLADEADAQKKRVELVDEFQDRINELHQDLERGASEIEARYTDQVAKAFRELADHVHDETDKLARDSERLNEDFLTKFGREGTSFGTDTLRDKEDFVTKQKREIEDAAKDREKLERDHNDKLADLNRDFEQAKSDDQRDQVTQRIDQENREYRERMDDFNSALKTRMQREEQDYNSRLTRLKEDFADKQEAERQDNQTRLQRMAQDSVDRIAIMQRETGERLADLEKEKNDSLAKLAQDIEDKGAKLAEELKKKLGDGATDAMKLVVDNLVKGLDDAIAAIQSKASSASSSVNAAGLSTAQNPNRWGGMSDATQAAFAANVQAADPGRDMRPRNPDGTIAGVPTPHLPNGDIDWGKVNARAIGGPVSALTPYLVGERGPELFIPRQAGTIVPNGGLSGSPTNLTVVVEMDRREIARTTASLTQDEQNRIVRVALV